MHFLAQLATVRQADSCTKASHSLKSPLMSHEQAISVSFLSIFLLRRPATGEVPRKREDMVRQRRMATGKINPRPCNETILIFSSLSSPALCLCTPQAMRIEHQHLRDPPDI